MKTAISLPDALFEEADTAAKELGMSRSRLIQTALEQFLKGRREDAITESINRYIAEHGSELSKEDEAWLAHNQELLRQVEWKE